MPCSGSNISYKIQSGDTLYRIASKFNVTVSEILSANGGISPNKLYIGQEICIPVKQPTLQIADQPILVNGVNINTGLYPVLNYKPFGAEYPYIYVPIAEFSKVGAVVNWDDVNQLLSVTTDYYTNKDVIAQQQAEINELQRQLSQPDQVVLPQPPNPSDLASQVDVTSIEGVTPGQKEEIYDLVETKTLFELNTMVTTANSEIERAAASKGGTYVTEGTHPPDGLVFMMRFDKNGSSLVSYNIRIHSNDPNLESNLGRYSSEQLERYRKIETATIYIILRDLVNRIRELP